MTQVFYVKNDSSFVIRVKSNEICCVRVVLKSIFWCGTRWTKNIRLVQEAGAAVPNNICDFFPKKPFKMNLEFSPYKSVIESQDLPI